MPRVRKPVVRPLVLAASTALLAPLLGGLSTVPASAAAAPYTVTPLKFTLDAGGTRCTVDADLYRPEGVSAADPAPAVMATNGFGGSKNDGSTDAIGKVFAARGLVSLVYTGLGFGKSGCPISLDDPRRDGRAASGLIDFLAGTRAADDGTKIDYVVKDGGRDPRVGMIGGSYGGAIQLATASADHRLDALVPLITWNDLAYSLAPNAADRATPGVYKYQWANGFFLMGEAQGLLNPSLDPSRVGGAGCLHFVADACRTKRLLDSGRYPAAETARVLRYARSVSPVSYLSTVKAPTLIIQGRADSLFTLDEAEATYRTLKAQGTETKLIWQSWGHSGGLTDPATGELNLAEGNLETSYTGRRILAWFDRHLHREPGTDTGPDFAYHRDWRSGYGTASDVPPMSRTLYLSGDGKLVEDRADVVSGSRGYRNALLPTSHSANHLAGLTGLSDPAPYDLKGTYLDWSTAPLTAPLDVVGAPRATLRVTSPRAERVQDSGDAADKLVLFAKLYDVAPDGTKTLVQRLVSPVRVPDVRREFTVDLPSVVHRYEAGHRLRLVIAASDDAYYGNRGIKPVTITSTAGGDTGVLELPAVK